MEFEIQTVPLADGRTTTTANPSADSAPVSSSEVDAIVAALIPESGALGTGEVLAEVESHTEYEVQAEPLQDHDRPVNEATEETPEHTFTTISVLELAEILDQHRIWVESAGESGNKADLCGVNLAKADLTGVNLQGAQLQRANLAGADLSMANLRGANLVQADLHDTNLLGAELRGANLMGANLYGAEGVWVGRLGGANLFDAILPETVAAFDSSKAIEDAT
ncbi:MAG TPA: pentapeptide repeat-containing protein, partial [Candidatus Eremiobacteraceae bacterium]|nr:pentapeptide repeat-containing protein [Candidatus Eremiobacteraceae bacterium]